MTVSDALVRYEVRDAVAVITLNRPPVNALSLEFMRELTGVCQRLSEDESARVGILTAPGPRVFCAGADVHELRALTPDSRRERTKVVRGTWIALSQVSVPMIAAITGVATGAGVVMCTLCDYRIAADHITMAMPEIDRGALGGGGAFFRHLGVPEGATRMLSYTGRHVGAQQALALNLVDEVVSAERVLPASHELAAEMAQKSREGLVLHKQGILLAARESNWLEGYTATGELQTQLAGTDHTKEGIDAFLQKREPQYQ